MGVLVYTFRTFPYQKELGVIFPEVCVLGKLKQDLELLYSSVIDTEPELILGVASSSNKISVFELKAVNQFNENGRIDKDGKKELGLYIPNILNSSFRISSKPTTSFCNYTMYKIQNFLDNNNIFIPFAFSHLGRRHIRELPKVLGLI